MKIYIDFDGVIVDTDKTINKLIKKEDKHEFIKNYDWELLIKESEIINNAIENIKNSKYDTYLLSKVSTTQEAKAKIKFLRKNKVNINLHFVPSGIDKNQVVQAKGNILIDDKIRNLDLWRQAGGISIYFNSKNEDTDIHGNINTKYKKVSDLKILTNEDIKILF